MTLVSPADRSTLLSVDPLVTLGDYIELAIALPYTIQPALPNFVFAPLIFPMGNGFETLVICRASLYKLAMMFTKDNHHAMRDSFPRALDQP